MTAAGLGPGTRDAPPLVVFTLDGQRFAVRLEQVERVALAAEVTPLPGAPAVVLGFIDLAGEIVPVLDVRRRFRGASRAVRASDCFVVMRTRARRLAVLVDEVEGLSRHTDLSAIDPDWARTSGAAPWFDGVVRIADELALIHDVEKFLSPGESQALGRAVEALQ